MDEAEHKLELSESNRFLFSRGCGLRLFSKKSLLPLLLIILSGTVALTSCFSQREENYSTTYWVWRPSDMSLVEKNGKVLLYQGDYLLAGQEYPFVKRGIHPAKLPTGDNVGLLVRLYEIEKPQQLAEEINYLLDQWVNVGAEITDIQLDYDSPSSGLIEYKTFIDQLKNNLGEQIGQKISITGLVSWVSDAPVESQQLSGSVNYIAYQLYEAFEPLTNLNSYLPHLNRLEHSYKIGVTTSANFIDMEYPKNEHYQGKLVFLNKPI